MLITNELEKFLKKYFSDIKASKNKITLFSDELSTTICIPSELYPIQNKKRMRLFASANTQTVLDSDKIDEEEKKKLKAAFNSTEFKTGQCYTNTENLRTNLLDNGLNEKDIKPFIGWIIVGNIPVHHSWLVYKNNFLLDGGMSLAEYEVKRRAYEERVTDMDSLRRVYTQVLKEEKEMDNIDVKTFGKVIPLYLYIGNPQEPVDGARDFSKLIDKYPKHPSYMNGGMNAKGASDLQQRVLEDN